MIILFLGLLGSGIYFLFKDSHFNREYILNKYSDIKDWCITNDENQRLTFNCQGLLIRLEQDIDKNSCFDVEIMTINNELKQLLICEQGNSLEYTNEILKYKMLLPVNIEFLYTKNNKPNEYTFTQVQISTLSNESIQNIVNKDINELISTDISATTIQNSIDFCPKPETLPVYITEENKIKYTEFYNTNKMSQEDYDDGIIYSFDDLIMRALFTCDSKNIAGYTDKCPDFNLEYSSDLREILSTIPLTPLWNTSMDEFDQSRLKGISLLYDSTNSITLLDKATFALKTISSVNINSNTEETFCGVYKLVSRLETDDITVKSYLEDIEDTLILNAEKIESSICKSIIRDSVAIDHTGLYLSILSRNNSYDNIFIMNRCYNLYSYMNN